VGRTFCALEAGSLVEHPSPLHVGLANEVLQEVLRPENPPDVLRQGQERIVVVAESWVSHSDAAEQNASQRTAGVGQMAPQVILDDQLGVTRAADWRRALHQAATGHPSDGFAE